MPIFPKQSYKDFIKSKSVAQDLHPSGIASKGERNKDGNISDNDRMSPRRRVFDKIEERLRGGKESYP
jgi:hypothetical protein